MIIYKITNLLDNKIYIGQDLKNNPNYYGSGIYLKNSIKLLGKNNFKKEIIEYCKTKDELNEREIFWIKELNSTSPNGYNLSKGGDGGDTYTHQNEERKKEIIQKRLESIEKNGGVYNKGKKMSDEQKKKISESRRGIKTPNRKKITLTEEHKNNISKSCKGKEINEDTRKKLSESRKGKKLSDEIKDKISENLKGNENALGYKHTEDGKRKISESKKGKPSWNKGLKMSDEMRKKLSVSKTGKKRLPYKIKIKN